MNIKKLALGAYQVNTYILWENDRALVIDPGYEPHVIQKGLETLGLELEAILLTHGHFDHLGAVKELVAATDCDVYIHAAEAALPPMMTAGPLYYTHTYDEGDRLTLAGMEFSVLHTPGHTPGSVCLVFGQDFFAGDTLFAGSCGRVDLPGGDPHVMMDTLDRLRMFATDYRIHPGHGGSTTLTQEKRYNPYLR